MMTGKEEEAFVPAQQEQRQNKAFDPFFDDDGDENGNINDINALRSLRRNDFES